MAMGPGKYDDVCARARLDAGLGEHDVGGVVLIVLGGKRGNGFSCQADLATTTMLPDMLETMARQIRADIKGWGSA
jgi:hypothetical protein